MKNILTYIVIILCLTLSIFLAKNNLFNKSSTKTNKKTNIIEKKKVDNKETKPNYYNKEYKERYTAYQKEFPNISFEDVVTRVNIGLDKPYYTNTKKTPYQNKDYILVNKYIYMESDYIPENLEDLDTSYSRSGMKLVKSAKDSLEKMIESAKNDGYTIRVMSSYRSYNYQVNLYNRYVNTDGKEAADTYSARPGFSEHQTGLCVDIDDSKINYTNFEKSESFKWMQENAHLYGFILRYPEDKTEITGYTYESWHYRYVGKEIATYIKKHNITFDEYYVKFIENKK